MNGACFSLLGNEKYAIAFETKFLLLDFDPKLRLMGLSETALKFAITKYEIRPTKLRLFQLVR